MARHVNKITLIGNVGKEPDLRVTPNGHYVCKASMATNRNRQSDGEWLQETTWHNLEVWGNMAESFSQKVHKGDLIYVEGRLEVEEWTSDDGVKHNRHKVVLSDFSALQQKAGAVEGDEEVDIPIS